VNTSTFTFAKRNFDDEFHALQALMKHPAHIAVKQRMKSLHLSMQGKVGLVLYRNHPHPDRHG